MIDVTCAVIRNDEDEILVVQRGSDTDHPLKWEFPGGKIRIGEMAEDCIIREIDEELSLDIVICGKLTPVEYDYGHKQVRLIPFVCDTLHDLPVLHEHVAYRWVDSADLEMIDFSEADIAVAQEYHSRYSNADKDNATVINDAVVDESGIREILGGNISVEACDMLAESAVHNSSLLLALIRLSLSGESRLAFRSSWCLTKAAEIDSSAIEPYYEELVNLLPRLETESVIRSIMKIISESDVTRLKEKSHGIIASCSFDWLNSAESAIAIKVYSMEALYKLSVIYPELSEELYSSVVRIMENASAGVKAKGRYVIKKLGKGN